MVAKVDDDCIEPWTFWVPENPVPCWEKIPFNQKVIRPVLSASVMLRVGSFLLQKESVNRKRELNV